MSVKVKIIPSAFLNTKMSLPELGSKNAGAYDVRANIDRAIRLDGNSVVRIPLGFRIQPQDENIHAILIARSGKGSQGLVMANQVGLIDNDYQGEVHAVLHNRNPVRSITIEPGDKIGQLAFVELPKAEFEIVDAFDFETERGENGFGSTDVVDKSEPVADEGIVDEEGEFEEVTDEGEDDFTANGVAISSITFTKESLSSMEMADLRDIGDFFKVKDNKKSELVGKILEAYAAYTDDTDV